MVVCHTGTHLTELRKDDTTRKRITRLVAADDTIIEEARAAGRWKVFLGVSCE
jgi:hypothetical protein